MTCPDRPHDLDLLLVGEPTDDAAASHAQDCATCAAEVALAQRIDAALVARREVVAPSALVADALAAARRQRPLAASRGPIALRGPAAARSRRMRGIAGVAFVLLALTTSWLAVRSPAPETAPAVAEATPEAVQSTPEPLATDDTTGFDIATTPQTTPEATPAPVTAPRRATQTAPRRTPRQRPSRALPTPAPSPEAAPDTAPAPQYAEAEPTPAEIQQAEAELRLAFALIASTQRQARRAVRDEAGSLSTALDTTIPFSR